MQAIREKLDNRISLDLNSWVNGLIILTAFVFPFHQNWAKTLMTLALVLWLFTLGDKKKIQFLRQSPVIRSAAVFLLVLSLSLLWTQDLDAGVNYVTRYVTYIFLPLLIIASSAERKTVGYIIKAFLFSMFLNELVSYGMLFGFIMQDGEPAEYPVVFMHHVPYSVLVAFTILLLGYEILRSRSKTRTVLYTVFFITMTGNLVISGGRTGQVVLLVTLFFVILIYARLSLRSLLIAVGLPALIFISAYAGYDQFRMRADRALVEAQKALNQETFNSSLGNRLASYIIAKRILSDGPSVLFGTGIGDINNAKNSVIAEGERQKMREALTHWHLHSYYLDTLVGTGLVGLAALLVLFYTIFRIPIADREIAYIKIVALLTVILADLPDRILHQQNTMLFFAVFVGILLAQNRIENDSAATTPAVR